MKNKQKIHEILANAVKNTPQISKLSVSDAFEFVGNWFGKAVSVLTKDSIEGVHLYPSIEDALYRRAKSVLNLDNDSIFYLSISNCNDDPITPLLGRKLYYFFAITDRGLYVAEENSKNPDRICIL